MQILRPEEWPTPLNRTLKTGFPCDSRRQIIVSHWESQKVGVIVIIGLRAANKSTAATKSLLTRFRISIPRSRLWTYQSRSKRKIRAVMWNIQLGAPTSSWRKRSPKMFRASWYRKKKSSGKTMKKIWATWIRIKNSHVPPLAKNTCKMTNWCKFRGVFKLLNRPEPKDNHEHKRRNRSLPIGSSS